MAIVKDAMFEKEYNCLTSDLVDNFPPTTDYELGAIMYAWKSGTKTLEASYKLLNVTGSKQWFKIV